MPEKKKTLDVNAEAVTEYEFYDGDGRGFNASPGETVGETVATVSKDDAYVPPAPVVDVPVDADSDS